MTVKLSTKIIWLVTAVITGIGLCAFAVSNRIMSRALATEMEEKAAIIAQVIAEHVTHNVLNGEVIPARQALQETVRDMSDVEYAYIIGFKHEIFAHSFEDNFPADLVPYRYDIPRLERYLSTQGHLIEVRYPLINGMDAMVCIGLNEHHLQAQIVNLRKWMLLLIFGISILGIGLSIIISRHTTRSLEQLAISMQDYGKGKRQERISPQQNECRETLQLAHAFNEMSEHHNKAEEEQNKLIEKVESINEELKDFAHIVSHDLKAPLRGVSSIANWLESDYADKLGAEGKEQLDLLISRVKRMHDFIEGVLQYSRASSAEEQQQQVNLNQLLTEAIDMVAPPDNIKITVESQLPTITCDQIRIAQVFQNLLSNAIKYMDKPQSQIKVNCIEEDSFWKFSVADNGPGIEEQYFERIFKMFQTLTSRDEFESTGVGLTVVKKIVEMYNGKIWVESKLGQGTTFFFTLPKQQGDVIEQTKINTAGELL